VRRTIPLAVLASVLWLSACGAPPRLVAGPPPPPTVTDGTFTMTDGVRLPYREWLPPGPPAIVVLAFHGIDDSRDAWERPGPILAAQGIAVIAPDQRGFGAAPDRGHWPGSRRLLLDARQMAILTEARYPTAHVYLAGESMGGAVLMALAASPLAPPVDGYVFSSPAVWGRREMNLLLRSTLWLADKTVPGMSFTGRGAGVRPSDDEAALVRLSTDPLTLTATRVSVIKGLVDLMDQALAAAGHIDGPALFLYGGHDELVPKDAMAAVWRAEMASGDGRVTYAFYPKGYHMLERDHEGRMVTEDIAHWLEDPRAPLPSRADERARAWIGTQPAG
jgi:acylglycerol lipase